MTTPQDAIAARRKLTNKLIAAKDAARLRPFFDPRVTLIAGDGSLLLGAEDVLAAFAGQFADKGFVAYVRTTEEITLDSEGTRAAERGRWVGTWKDAPQQSGTYLATWKKVTGQWVIENELFVTLA
ncbi:nuclear transport factor 2 family protein [Caulobacter sp. SL161]|uniref:nuclear transport factor 2 family protein n=1 Tax=Caulobacter sp. SL161 TaxID=2995156 RepID=UPI0022768B80|nr:nuclear transport factor 2 family protein [Caulobacter sp. SL161]MCY1647084.1 nuclear transport factor 2 family protein [Caulobacter sp. SL161]